jgi:hypothetical protein
MLQVEMCMKKGRDISDSTFEVKLAKEPSL